MAMETIEVTLVGTTPLMHRNGQMANSRNPLTRQVNALYKALKRKGADTDAILDEISDLDWEGGLYYDPKLGPVLNSSMFKACIIQGAKLTRGGRNVERCVNVLGVTSPLEYEGPRDIPSLKKNPNFRDERMVKIGTSSVLRTRPLFKEWTVTFKIAFNTEGLSRDDLLRYIRDAGMFEGMGDHRGKGCFGRFQIHSVKDI